MEHQRRLAGAVGAEHGDALAVGDVRSTPRSAAACRRVGEASARARWTAQLMPRTAQRSRQRPRGRRRTRASAARSAARERAAWRPRSRARASPRGRARRARRRAGTARSRGVRSRRPCEHVARAVAARGERRPHPPDLVGDDEQVAPHEGGDQRRAARGTRRRSRPRSDAGQLVVAPSRTAPRVPIVALPPPRRRPRARPRTRSAGRARRRCRRGGRTARRRHEHDRQEDERRAARARARGRARRRDRASRSAHAASTGHAAGGVDTATSVTPASPSSLARGSSRCTGLAGSPGQPRRTSEAVQAAHATALAGGARPTATRRRSRARTRRACRRSPARPVASARVLDAGEGVVRQRARPRPCRRALGEAAGRRRPAPGRRATPEAYGDSAGEADRDAGRARRATERGASSTPPAATRGHAGGGSGGAGAR